MARELLDEAHTLSTPFVVLTAEVNDFLLKRFCSVMQNGGHLQKNVIALSLRRHTADGRFAVLSVLVA